MDERAALPAEAGTTSGEFVVTAFSIVGLSSGASRLSPCSILVASLIDALVERSYSLGRVFHLVEAETAAAPTWIDHVEQADLLVLGVQMDRGGLQRFERHLDLVGAHGLVDKTVLLASVADRPNRTTGLEQVIRPLVVARGAHVLPHTVRATHAGMAGRRLVDPELARDVRAVADRVAAGLDTKEAFCPAELHGLVRAHC